MYDDLLGPKPKAKKLKAKFNLADDNAKPANPDKYPSHESARNTTKDAQGHGSVSSCSDSGVQSDCGGDCGVCDDECEAPTPKDPWSDVTPGPDPKLPDWADDDCEGDCDNCDDEVCKNIDDFFGDLDEFFEDDDEDGDGSWLK